MRFVVLAFVMSAFVFAACGGDPGAEAYPTYQECFDDHVTVETLPVPQAITVCCLEHPINGVTMVCGATAADCMTYLAANLSSTSATAAQITTACNDYVTQKGM
jgi:hypothetical protein